ncbi:hypothetical protein EBZ37_07740 [bacterium]|nr:hypothetical protein [bacterium]
MPILKLSLRAWRSSPGSQFGASLISSALLLAVALLVCLELSMSSARGKLEHENRISVFLSPTVPASDEDKLTDQIRESLGAHAESIVQSKFVPVQDTMGYLKENHPDLYAEIRDLGEEGQSLVPRVVHVTALFDSEALSTSVSAVQKIGGVESVETTEARAAALRPAVRGLQWLVRLLTIGVAAAWILGWIALARSHAASLAGISAPLRLWGAADWTARTPGMLAGFWVGLPAGVIAAIAYSFFARPVMMRLATSSSLFDSAAIPGFSGLMVILVTSSIAGLASGALSGSAEA